MKKIKRQLFSNGTEFMSWTYYNCDNCIKQSKYNEKKDTYSAFKCSIDKEIQLQAASMDESEYVSQKSIDTVKLLKCPFIQTERKKVTKKRILKGQLNLEL